MTIEQEAIELVKVFWEITGQYPLSVHENLFNISLSENWQSIKIAKQCAILHCEKIREHDKKIADALEAVGIAMDDEYYTNLMNAIKKPLNMTIEQAQKEAERRYPNEGNTHIKVLHKFSRNDFTAGAQWAQEQTKDEAIGFAEWINKEDYERLYSGDWINSTEAGDICDEFNNGQGLREPKRHTTEQLYELFKNTPQ